MTKFAVLTAISAFASVAAAQTVVIDDFTSGDYQRTFTNADPGTSQEQSFQNGTMIGGRRLTFFDVETNPLNRPVSLEMGSGFAFAENGAGATTRIQLAYGFRPSGIPGLILQDPLGLDFDALNVDFATNDLPVTVTATAYRDFLNAVSVTKTFAPGSGVLSFDASEFGTSFTATALAFDFRTQPSGDFTLRGINAAVPEPASMAVLGLGLAALKRRRNAKK